MTRLFAFAAILAGASLGLIAAGQSAPIIAPAPQGAGHSEGALDAVAGKIAENLASIPEIAKSQARLTIAVKPGADATSSPSSLPAITHRLAAALNSSSLRDKISFVSSNAPSQASTKPARSTSRPAATATTRAASTRAASTRPAMTRPASTRPTRTRGAVPTPTAANYTLTLDLNRKTADSPYLLVVRLTDAGTGKETFESSYEVQEVK